MISALRRLGGNYVFDTNFGADLAIMEEASELLYRMDNKKELLPQFTSACPSWVEFTEIFFPELIPHLSTGKSPSSMLSQMIKTYFAKRMHIDPSNLVIVSVTPVRQRRRKSFGRNRMLPAVTGSIRTCAIPITPSRRGNWRPGSKRKKSTLIRWKMLLTIRSLANRPAAETSLATVRIDGSGSPDARLLEDP